MKTQHTPKSKELDESTLRQLHKEIEIREKLFIRSVGMNYQIEREGNGLRSIVARIYDPEICPEHGDAKSYAEFIVRAVNSFEDILGELKIAHERDCVSRGICDETCGVREAIARAEGKP